MIHKYLLLGKLVSLSSVKVENPEEKNSAVELQLPLEVFWGVSEQLQRATLLLVQGAPGADVQKLYQQVYATVIPYTVNEAERASLRKRMAGGG
jgi:hypothetical protein